MAYYKKPADVSYTQMCIWIDEHAYSDDCDDEKLFEYLYHIMNMLAYKRRFFEKSAYYDDYAIYAATRIFMRLKNKRQFECNNNEKCLTKIKSVLNYAKKVLYPTKVAFESDNYAQNYVQLPEKFTLYDSDFHNTVISSVDGLKIADFNAYLDGVVSTIKSFVYKLPHSKKSEIQNIYLSCVLSMLNSIVLDNKNKAKYNELKRSGKLKQDHINKFYKLERQDCVILYHLDLSMKNYIAVIVNELRHLLAGDLSYILNDSIQSEANMKNLLISSINLDLGSDCDDCEA